ncbi:N-acetyltransferase [Mesonia sp. K7]|uniref:N-acetyltransferase n=1 Tax=Mesonia sp. K7 TaxID=2218606 RepID=UPI000DA7C9A6|nr:N-acetyltransferase [Mesonia sp. K7]PZD77902.1 N-acetyltransferase [Mesonia sp. K7]
MKNEEINIKNNEFLRQFEAMVDDDFIKLEYSEQERKIFLSKFIIDDKNTKNGVSEKFLTAVFDYVLDKGRTRIVPTSKEVRKFFKANKHKYEELLPIGMSI